MTRQGMLMLLVAGCLLIGCNKHREPGRVYDAEHGFSIVPPQGWTKAPPPPGCFMLFTGPIEVFPGPTEEEFLLNLNVVVEQGTASPEQSLAQGKTAISNLFMGYEPMDERVLTIDGHEAAMLSSAFDTSLGRIQNLQYQILTSSKTYTFTFTAPQAVFEKYRAVFEQSALSARID